MKNAEHKKICICIDGYQIYQDNDFDKVSEALSEVKNRKLKNKDIFTEIYKGSNENLLNETEKNYCSRATIGIQEIGNVFLRLMNWLSSYDRPHYKKNCSDLMSSVLICLNELAER